MKDVVPSFARGVAENLLPAVGVGRQSLDLRLAELGAGFASGVELGVAGVVVVVPVVCSKTKSANKRTE